MPRTAQIASTRNVDAQLADEVHLVSRGELAEQLVHCAFHRRPPPGDRVRHEGLAEDAAQRGMTRRVVEGHEAARELDEPDVVLVLGIAGDGPLIDEVAAEVGVNRDCLHIVVPEREEGVGWGEKVDAVADLAGLVIERRGVLGFALEYLGDELGGAV